MQCCIQKYVLSKKILSKIFDQTFLELMFLNKKQQQTTTTILMGSDTIEIKLVFSRNILHTGYPELEIGVELGNLVPRNNLVFQKVFVALRY